MEEKRTPGSRRSHEDGFDWGGVLSGKSGGIILGTAGLVLVGAGVASFFNFKKEPAIEILPVEETPLDSTVWVDLGGAVEKPGIYELPGEMRLNDLLIRAGGLSSQADGQWVDKNLNLAQKLNDGAKIYIPFRDEARSYQGDSGQLVGEKTTGRININTALASELESLWGIGSKRAADIIQNRPYNSPEDLLKRQIISKSVYDRIKEQITVF